MNRVNYHTHTSRCKHAIGSDEEYVKKAIQNGYTTLGFSDHSVWKYDSDFEPMIRMKLNEFHEYKQSILHLKEKYKDQIHIELGMEVEYFPKYMNWMKQFLAQEDLDYIIFGNHYYLSDETGIYYGYCPRQYVQKYFNSCIEGMKTGLYSYLAHPELIMRNHYLTWNDEIERQFKRICMTAKDLNLPLEYNVLGMQYNRAFHCECYPHHKFWELASQCHNKAIIGMDAHQPDDLDHRLYDQALFNLQALDIEIMDIIPKVNFKS